MASRLFDDASNEYLEATSFTEVVEAPFTLMAWAKSDRNNANQTVISMGDTDGNVDFWQVYFNGAGGTTFLCFDGASNQQATVGSGTINTGVWYHVAGVAASATSRNAAIGGLFGTTATDDLTPDDSDTIRIGIRVNSGATTQAFSGEIDEGLLVNLALTSAELTSIKDGFMPRRIRPKNIKGQWRTGRDSPEKDVSFFSNNLTLNNSPAVSSDSPPTRIKPFNRDHRNRSRGMRRQIAKGTSTGGFDP